MQCVLLTDIDFCVSSPCMNNATCEDQVRGYDCHCQSGYNGTICNLGMYE